LQTNGYSLARKLFFEVGGYKTDSYVDELGATVGDALLATHSSFLPQIGPLLDSGKIKGLAHITGGGFLENIPRILPDGLSAVVRRGTWPELPIFGLMQRLGNVADKEMFRTFNMGIGMIVIVAAADVASVRDQLGECFEIGNVGTRLDESVIIDGLE
jgi:phosphoribosylformylglycinamidine cyclo-ligase